MAQFSTTVDAFWRASLVRGEVVCQAGALLIVCDPDLADERRVMITNVSGAATIAALSPAVAARVLVRPIRDESELRAALADAHVLLHPPDAVYYFSLTAKEELLGEPAGANVRRLTEDDRDAFAAFASAAPAQDVDDAFVELDHWAVFGAFDEQRLVCAASAYPWDGSDLVDLGVLTLPDLRRRGRARAVVREIARHAYREGREPQYRCQLDNHASRALAVSAGLTCFAYWEVIAPQPPV